MCLGGESGGKEEGKEIEKTKQGKLRSQRTRTTTKKRVQAKTKKQAEREESGETNNRRRAFLLFIVLS